MKNICCITIVALIMVFSCGETPEASFISISDVEIRNILIDSSINVRALEVLKGVEGAAFLTSDGRFGSFFNPGNDILPGSGEYIMPPMVELEYDTIKPNFRALAVGDNMGYGLAIGNPALLFSLEAGHEIVVYKEDHEKVFYDSMEFWNAEEGLAIGDPTDDCMSIIITRDGGRNWIKLPCSDLPEAEPGEAAFAASDTNIAIYGDKAWVATGGMKSSILFTPDKGNTWAIYETPILQGKPTTGIYSIDFYNEQIGYAIGGDYTDPESNFGNKMRTEDGGKTWKLIDGGPGYRSCVQFIPGSRGNGLVAVGFDGVDVSNDGGFNWIQLSESEFYTIRFLNDSTAFAAGKGRVSKLLFK
ncbi:MAG: oxidoreductase [Flavobacteriaceae bacterium]|nr:oxidoreductase [Flavobacteriaceae bacterium]